MELFLGDRFSTDEWNMLLEKGKSSQTVKITSYQPPSDSTSNDRSITIINDGDELYLHIEGITTDLLHLNLNSMKLHSWRRRGNVYRSTPLEEQTEPLPSTSVQTVVAPTLREERDRIDQLLDQLEEDYRTMQEKLDRYCAQESNMPFVSSEDTRSISSFYSGLDSTHTSSFERTFLSDEGFAGRSRHSSYDSSVGRYLTPGKREDLSSDVGSLKSQMRQLRRENTSLRNDVSVAQSHLRNSELECDEIRRTLRARELDIDGLKKEKGSLTTRCKDLENSLERSRRECTKKDDTINDLQSKLVSSNVANEHLRSMIRSGKK